jgi:hypothetical protein
MLPQAPITDLGKSEDETTRKMEADEAKECGSTLGHGGPFLFPFRRLCFGVLIAVFLMPGAIWGATRAQQAQTPSNGQQGMGGIAGGLGAAPVYDAQKRPITADGFVDKGPRWSSKTSPNRRGFPAGATNGRAGEELHSRNQRLGRSPARLRQ